MLVEERKLSYGLGTFSVTVVKDPLEGEESPVVSLWVFEGSSIVLMPSLLQTWIRKLSLDDTVLLPFPR